MKLSKSKLALAKVINENGGWVGDSSMFAAQDGDHTIGFYELKPTWMVKYKWWNLEYFGREIEIFTDGCRIKNHYQTILSREEYYHAYPKADAEGWIEWKGGECPVDVDLTVYVNYRDGGKTPTAAKAGSQRWNHSGLGGDIMSYSLHLPEVKPEFCESVMRSIPEPEAKPTIEQLAQDYRNKLGFANRKKLEAEDAKAVADAAMGELERAGEALGLLIGIAKPEPELVIADWRDLQIGDIIEYVDGDIKDKIGMSGPVVEFEPSASDSLFVRLKCDNGKNKGRTGWPRKWRFIRRP